MGGSAEGFEFMVGAGGDVQIFHHGTLATTLRGRRAVDFLDDVEAGDEQQLMARLTGNYKRGNERVARNHPRNRGRS
jgi:hypothetical protein